MKKLYVLCIAFVLQSCVYASNGIDTTNGCIKVDLRQNDSDNDVVSRSQSPNSILVDAQSSTPIQFARPVSRRSQVDMSNDNEQSFTDSENMLNQKIVNPYDQPMQNDIRKYMSFSEDSDATQLDQSARNENYAFNVSFTLYQDDDCQLEQQGSQSVDPEVIKKLNKRLQVDREAIEAHRRAEFNYTPPSDVSLRNIARRAAADKSDNFDDKKQRQQRKIAYFNNYEDSDAMQSDQGTKNKSEAFRVSFALDQDDCQLEQQQLQSFDSTKVPKKFNKKLRVDQEAIETRRRAEFNYTPPSNVSLTEIARRSVADKNNDCRDTK